MRAAELFVLRLDAWALADLRRALLEHRMLCRARGGRQHPSLVELARQIEDQGGQRRPVAVPVSEPVQCEAVLLTYDEAGQALGVSGRSVRRLVSAGRLRAVAVGGARRIHRGDLEAFADNLRETT